MRAVKIGAKLLLLHLTEQRPTVMTRWATIVMIQQVIAKLLHQILKLESKELLRELLSYGKSGTEPLLYHRNIQRYSLNLVLTLNYGTRIADTKDMKSGNLSEVIYVESEISKLRSTAVNYSNYIPFLRFFELFQKSNTHGANIGKRRRDYNNILLDELKAKIKAGTDEPCIQGNVLKDPDAILSRDELTSISLSMMAVSTTKVLRAFVN